MGLEFTIFLSQPPHGWNYRPTPLGLIEFPLGLVLLFETVFHTVTQCGRELLAIPLLLKTGVIGMSYHTGLTH